MLDTGAFGVSIAGKPQVIALQKYDLLIKIDTSITGLYQIKFGAGEAVSIGIIYVTTPIGNIPFYVLPTNTPFLLYL
jgi:hypothetical protein